MSVNNKITHVELNGDRVRIERENGYSGEYRQSASGYEYELGEYHVTGYSEDRLGCVVSSLINSGAALVTLYGGGWEIDLIT